MKKLLGTIIAGGLVFTAFFANGTLSLNSMSANADMRSGSYSVIDYTNSDKLLKSDGSLSSKNILPSVLGETISSRWTIILKTMR